MKVVLPGGGIVLGPMGWNQAPMKSHLKTLKILILVIKSGHFPKGHMVSSAVLHVYFGRFSGK